MNEAILKSGRDVLLVAIPLVALLFMGVFRLDEAILCRGKKLRRDPPGRVVDEQGRTIFTDPDGRPTIRK